jgi:hypothetical protein
MESSKSLRRSFGKYRNDERITWMLFNPGPELADNFNRLITEYSHL